MDFMKFELDKISLQSCYYMMNLRLCLFNTIAYLAKFSFLPLAASPLAASFLPLAASPLAASFHPLAAYHTALLAVACPNLHSHPGGNYYIMTTCTMYNTITNPTPDMVSI